MSSSFSGTIVQAGLALLINKNEEATEDRLRPTPDPSSARTEPTGILVTSGGDAERRIQVRARQGNAETGGNTARDRLSRPFAAQRTQEIGNRSGA